MSGDWKYLVPLAVILLFSMVLHELMHGYVAYRLGDPTAKSRGRLTLNPLHHLDPLGTAMFFLTYLWGGFIFGWAKPIPVQPYYFRDRQRGMAWVGLAGPLTNFAIAVVFWAILIFLKPVLVTEMSGGLYFKSDFAVAVFEILRLALMVNVSLGIFTLTPIPPLDGSRVVAFFLPRKYYDTWASLDQYGVYFMVLIIIFLNYSHLFSRGYAVLMKTILWPYF